jgi:very-short-patch-repair endonuclease
VRHLHPEDWRVVRAIPVTSVARTSLDLAEVLPLRQVIRVLEQAERLGVFDLRAFERLLARAHGRHGIKPLKLALAEAGAEPPRTNSDWERDLLDFCVDYDIRKPELNAIVEGYVVDALWRHAKLIVELDSWEHHRSRTAFEEDRRRDAALQLAGYTVLRITWRRFENEPEEVARTLRPRV